MHVPQEQCRLSHVQRKSVIMRVKRSGALHRPQRVVEPSQLHGRARRPCVRCPAAFTRMMADICRAITWSDCIPACMLSRCTKVHMIQGSETGTTDSDARSLPRSAVQGGWPAAAAWRRRWIPRCVRHWTAEPAPKPRSRPPWWCAHLCASGVGAACLTVHHGLLSKRLQKPLAFFAKTSFFKHKTKAATNDFALSLLLNLYSLETAKKELYLLSVLTV